MTLENVVVYIVVGLIAGFLASRIVLGKGRGWLMDILIGIVGAIVGGWLANQLHIQVNLGPDILNKIIIAFVGAVILLLIWRLIFRGRRK
ncbi:MAG: GlsB/YeaQ/YmgE family stress response membrane protein [Chloroflexi bacterium]|nr:MAG: GlsB/YeaQ/YmgE family stress response membrane protein [Chloroflexota bacterium]